MACRNRAPIPALRYHVLTPLFDWVMRVFMRERTLKPALVHQAGIRPGQRVVDVGSGTGTLMLEVRAACPAAPVMGFDIDTRILEMARRKLGPPGSSVFLLRASALAMPLARGSADRILSSLCLHHLDTRAKERTLQEMRRVLRPGGEVHIADWGPPHHLLLALAFLPVRLLNGFAQTRDHAEGRIPALLSSAGFADAAEVRRFITLSAS